MIIFNKIQDLSSHSQKLLNDKKKIGFVPTMGALHEGHLTLVDRAKKENDVVVVSIFVNPTQFNDAADLKNYPRTPESDHLLLKKREVNILFSPDVEEIYSTYEKPKNNFQIGPIASVMEGVHRAGHFDGVVQIVSKLFDIVKPHHAYFGEKDFQQLAIIKLMVKKLNYPVEIVACPTVREKNGLAMSSRNLKLSSEGREAASDISKALNFINENWKTLSPIEIKQKAIEKIESAGALKIEYLEIADEETLQQVKSWDQFKHIRCFAAVYCEGIRLIDNIRLF